MAHNIEALQYLMSRLRDPVDGCPWDLKQDFASIVPSTLEEAYEVADTIEKQDWSHLQEELGDLLFQVIFYSQLAKEKQLFNFPQVVDALTAKLIRRHPHVFPQGTLESRVGAGENRDEKQIKANWEATKDAERQAKGKRGVLADIPVGLPALSRAAKLQKRAANVGFDWPTVEGAFAKVKEETREFEDCLKGDDPEKLAEELGDLLFAMVNVARHLKFDPEALLRAANRKFERRFSHVENRVEQSGQAMADVSLEELDRHWDEAKERGM